MPFLSSKAYFWSHTIYQYLSYSLLFAVGMDLRNFECTWMKYSRSWRTSLPLLGENFMHLVLISALLSQLVNFSMKLSANGTSSSGPWQPLRQLYCVNQKHLTCKYTSYMLLGIMCFQSEYLGPLNPIQHNPCEIPLWLVLHSYHLLTGRTRAPRWKREVPSDQLQGFPLSTHSN